MSLYPVFPRKHFHPVHLLFRRYKFVLLQAFSHIVNKFALVFTYTGTTLRSTVKKCLELLDLLAQCSHFRGRENIASLGSTGFLPLAIGLHVTIPPAYAAQFVTSPVLPIPPVPPY